MMSEPPYHFKDRGFEFDFFQVLGQARRHRQYLDAATTASARAREHNASCSSASGRFKLHMSIGKEQEKKKKSSSSRDRKHRWSWPWSSLRSALDLFYFKVKGPVHIDNFHQGQPDNPQSQRSSAKAIARHLGHSVSGPLYLAESRNTLHTRHRGYSQSGPLAERVPYVCLTSDFKSTAAPHPPLYLVT